MLRLERHVAGIGTRAIVPLFHLRAVVVRRQRRGGFVAALERRNGPPIVIDTGERGAPLYALVQTIAEVTELRLVYDTTAASCCWNMASTCGTPSQCALSAHTC